MQTVAKIYNGFESKFGIPRQGGLVGIMSEIVFESKFKNPAAIKGLEEFSHIWLIWNFSDSKDSHDTITVRPPRLGGNKKVGVFATRSPFRPNPIGLSVVKLEKIYIDEKRGPVLVVSGADLKNGTPIYDIKPYIPIFDSVPSASAGFAEKTFEHFLEVVWEENAKRGLDPDLIEKITSLLSQDPKPSYQNEQGRIYGMKFSGYEIKFIYQNNFIKVCDVFSVNC